MEEQAAMAGLAAPPRQILSLSRLPSLGALAALLVLSLRQQIRGWRLIVLGLLFLLPSALAVVVVLTSPRAHPPSADQFDLGMVYMIVANALAPLAALLCAAGVVRDEVEEQTLTYLLLRPLPRGAIYAVKLLAAIITTVLLTVFFVVVTLVVVDRLATEPGGPPLANKAIHAAMIFSVTQTAYCALFGLMGLIMRRSLVIGVAYIIVFEGILAAFDTLVRKVTVMYYFRVLVMRWLHPRDAGKLWSIDLAKSPCATSCVLTLLITALVLAAIGALVLSTREFRMKTPEGE
jgi:ABC-2 type transport system permease protein